VASGPPALNQATRSPCSSTCFLLAADPSVWQFMQRKRIGQTLSVNDSSRRSFRAWRITSSGRAGFASFPASSFGKARSFGSAALRLTHSANASYSASRAFWWTRAALVLSSSPILIRARIFDFSGLSRSISPWSRSDANVSSCDGRM